MPASEEYYRARMSRGGASPYTQSGLYGTHLNLLTKGAEDEQRRMERLGDIEAAGEREKWRAINQVPREIIDQYRTGKDRAMAEEEHAQRMQSEARKAAYEQAAMDYDFGTEEGQSKPRYIARMEQQSDIQKRLADAQIGATQAGTQATQEQTRAAQLAREAAKKQAIIAEANRLYGAAAQQPAIYSGGGQMSGNELSAQADKLLATIGMTPAQARAYQIESARQQRLNQQAEVIGQTSSELALPGVAEAQQQAGQLQLATQNLQNLVSNLQTYQDTGFYDPASSVTWRNISENLAKIPGQENTAAELSEAGIYSTAGTRTDRGIRAASKAIADLEQQLAAAKIQARNSPTTLNQLAAIEQQIKSAKNSLDNGTPMKTKGQNKIDLFGLLGAKNKNPPQIQQAVYQQPPVGENPITQPQQPQRRQAPNVGMKNTMRGRAFSQPQGPRQP